MGINNLDSDLVYQQQMHFLRLIALLGIIWITITISISIFLDIQKAFDSVDHTILLNKLDQSGII